jgi:putative transcriptional regulator
MKNKLEIFRKSKELTQEELAKALGVSRQTIHSIETEKYLPSIILAFKIASHFGVRIEDVFIYNGSRDT